MHTCHCQVLPIRSIGPVWLQNRSPDRHALTLDFLGFYVLVPMQEGQLILGPFQGKVACQTIAFGRGVCGTAAASGQTQLVHDVEQYPGHIACDADSASEVVVPIISEGKVRSPTFVFGNYNTGKVSSLICGFCLFLLTVIVGDLSFSKSSSLPCYMHRI